MVAVSLKKLFFKQKTAYEISCSLVGSEMCIRDSNEHQRQGWVLRMALDKQGVRLFDTHVARIDMQGIPLRDLTVPSPCWQRGEAAIGQCVAGR